MYFRLHFLYFLRYLQQLISRIALRGEWNCWFAHGEGWQLHDIRVGLGIFWKGIVQASWSHLIACLEETEGIWWFGVSAKFHFIFIVFWVKLIIISILLRTKKRVGYIFKSTNQHFYIIFINKDKCPAQPTKCPIYWRKGQARVLASSTSK